MFTFDKDCYKEGEDATMTATYTGSGTVTGLKWYHSGETTGNTLQLSSCSIFGSTDSAFPNSRLSYDCNSPIFKTKLSPVESSDDKTEWGVTFTVTGATAQSLVKKQLVICTGTLFVKVIYNSNTIPFKRSVFYKIYTCISSSIIRL